MLAAQDGARAGDRDEHVATLGGLQRRHDLEAVHPRLQRTHRIHLAHDHRRARAARALRDPLARPAVADDHQRVAGQQEIGRAQDAVQRRLPRAVAVVEGTLGKRLVDCEHREGEPAGGLEAADTDQTRGGLLRPAEDALGRPALVQVGAVVDGHRRRGRGQGPDVRGERVGALAAHGADRDPATHQRRRDVVLRGQRVGGAQADGGPAGRQGIREVGRLRGDVQARGHPDAVERPLLGEALADRAQHRHLALGPRDACLSLAGEGEVGDVVRGRGGLRAQ